MEIYKIVLTGGPCGGKTKTFNYVSERLREDGYYVITVPETATYCIKNGLLPNGDKEHTLRFQEYILLFQTMKEQVSEDYAEKLANNEIDIVKDKKGIVILYDRGIMDNRAYLSHEEYNNLLRKYNYNEISIIDKYDLVINLISTATAMKEEYLLDDVRDESVALAERIDKITSGAWLLHRNLYFVKPTKRIEEKFDIVLSLIYDLINNKGKKDSIEVLVDEDKTDFTPYNNDNSRRINIRRIYLDGVDGKTLVLNRRIYNGGVAYVRDEFSSPSAEVITRKSVPISVEEYLNFVGNGNIKQLEDEELLSVVDNGNYYKFRKMDSSMYLEFEDKNNIPSNIVLKKNKNFI